MLIDLTDARGVPGNEGEVREVFRRYAEPFAESFSQDGLGGLFAKHTAWIPDKIITWIVKRLINQCLPVEPRYKLLQRFITRFVEKDRRYGLFQYHVIIIRE